MYEIIFIRYANAPCLIMAGLSIFFLLYDALRVVINHFLGVIYAVQA